MFPFPNNFWLRNTGGPTPTLYFSNDTFPQDWLGVPIRAEQEGWNGLDGFSPIPSIMTYFENAALDGCPRLWDIAASLAPTSCTILLDTVTGDIVRAPPPFSSSCQHLAISRTACLALPSSPRALSVSSVCVCLLSHAVAALDGAGPCFR